MVRCGRAVNGKRVASQNHPQMRWVPSRHPGFRRDDGRADPCYRASMADTLDETASPRRIANLALIWRFTARYKGHVLGALLALLVAAAATLAIPAAFKLIIDRGFTGAGGDIGRWFQYLLLIVVVMAIATATRFYFVSWLGERVVADVREAVQRNLLRLAPSFFEENRPSEIASRLTADTTVIEQVVGTTLDRKSTRLNSSHGYISYAVFCLKKKKNKIK